MAEDFLLSTCGPDENKEKAEMRELKKYLSTAGYTSNAEVYYPNVMQTFVLSG